jgi:outer membrane protein
MNRKALIVAICCLLPAACSYGQQAERVMTLDESILTGTQNSQDLLIAGEQAIIAAQMVKESKAMIFPKIDFNFNASRFRSEFPTVLTPEFGSLYLPTGSMDSYYSTRLSLWQYLYAGGRYTKNVQLAEANLKQAQAMSDTIKNRTTRDVKKVFFSLLAAKEKIKAYEEAVAAGEAKYRGIPERARWLSLTKSELAKARHDYEVGQLDFLDKLGIELNTVVDVEGALKSPEGEYEVNKCLAWAFQNRPELRQTQYQETMNALNVNLSQIARKASISLGANYEWAGGDLDLSQKNWNATINMNFPVFDGLASVARTKQRTHQEIESKIRRSEIEDQIRLDVRRSLMDLAFWKEQEASAGAKKAEASEPDRKLDAVLQWIEAARQAMSCQADLEWAIGKSLK